MRGLLFPCLVVLVACGDPPAEALSPDVEPLLPAEDVMLHATATADVSSRVVPALRGSLAPAEMTSLTARLVELSNTLDQRRADDVGRAAEALERAVDGVRTDAETPPDAWADLDAVHYVVDALRSDLFPAGLRASPRMPR